MKKLNYLVSWRGNKETSWSGTNYSLYKALKDHYNVSDYDLKSNRLENFVMGRLLKMDNMTIEYHLRHILRHKLQHINGDVFQFSEILQDSNSRRTYIYLDASVSYVNYLRSHKPAIYAISAFQNSNIKVLEQRQKEQDEYLQNCSGIFTMGHWLKEWLITQGLPSDRIHAVGGGNNINAKLIAPQTKSRNKILFIGKDFKRKGGYITYEAFKLLHQQHQDLELYVIGPSKDPITNPIDGYNYIGEIPFEEEAKYYNTCDVFCMPSYFEAYGLVFAEALTFGLPCIGRNCYEMPYFIENGKTGMLLEQDDPKELARLIKHILDNDSFVNNVKTNKQQYLHDFSWETVAEKIANVIG